MSALTPVNHRAIIARLFPCTFEVMGAQKRTDPPEGWWVRLARPLVIDYSAKHGFTVLSKNLARKAGRSRPWNHAAFSRFVAKGQCSADLAAAISQFFKLPRPAFVARSVKEAWAMEATVSEYDAVTPEQAEADFEAEVIDLRKRSAERQREEEQETIRAQIAELQKRLEESEHSAADRQRSRARRHAR